jgi:hypothetical protein
VRTLSQRRERTAAWLAGALGAGFVLACMATVMAGVATVQRVVHAPTFFTFWTLAAATVATLCATWARRRCQRYRIGVDMEADAFSPEEVDLVRRNGEDYDLGLVPGMSGTLDGGRAGVPIEALTSRGPIRVPLPADGTVRIELGRTTFVVGRTAVDPVRVWPLLARLVGSGGPASRRVVRMAGLGVAAATFASALVTVPSVSAVADAELRRGPQRTVAGLRMIPVRLATPDEGLRACFEAVAPICRRWAADEARLGAGFTSPAEYGEDCVVNACITSFVSRWLDERAISAPAPAAAPVEAIRTDGPAATERVIFLTPEIVRGEILHDVEPGPGF